MLQNAGKIWDPLPIGEKEQSTEALWPVPLYFLFWRTRYRKSIAIFCPFFHWNVLFNPFQNYNYKIPFSKCHYQINSHLYLKSNSATTAVWTGDLVHYKMQYMYLLLKCTKYLRPPNKACGIWVFNEHLSLLIF